MYIVLEEQRKANSTSRTGSEICWAGAARRPSNGVAWKKPKTAAAAGAPSGLAAVLRCAACRVDCSGEESFVQHLGGRAHASRCGGRKGFAGLLPNDAGFIPELSFSGLLLPELLGFIPEFFLPE